MKKINNKILKLALLLAVVSVVFTSCTKEESNTEASTIASTTKNSTTTESIVESTSDITSETTEKTTEELTTLTTTTATSTTTTKTTKTTKATSKSSNSSISSTGKKIVTNAEGLTYVDGILIANKTYKLPSDYNPGVNSTAMSALNKMIAAAKQSGITLTIISGFRSYSTQYSIYNNYVARDGKAEADRYSARPGNSEHQTGYAFDLNSLSQSFENTPEGKWIAANCYKYGFILRYPKGKESVTGYMYEPWHVRYLGTSMAEDVYDSGLCLEEYLGITSQY